MNGYNNLQWYPGHMTKAFRQMKEDLKLIDLIIEICDARIPYSSRNPEIEKLTNGKSRIVLLNKSDLADADVTRKWQAHFKKNGVYAASMDGRDKSQARAVRTVIDAASEAKRERDARRGIQNRSIRAMVVGIPNSGKSTFINSYAGKAVAKTGNKPGVTKGRQWIRLNKQAELLDTPGVLWPKFEDESVGLHLACVGAIKDDIFEKISLVMDLAAMLRRIYPSAISGAYGIEECEGEQLLLAVAKKRGCVKAGGEADYDKAAGVILDDFRRGKLGRISLERVEDE